MMSKHFTTLVLLIFWCITNLRAQEKPATLIKGESASVSKNLVKVETFFPNLLGVSYEKKIKQNISLYSMIGVLGNYGGGSISQATYGVDSYYVLIPQVTIQPRFYHNLGKRAASDKNTNFNSANYVGLSARVYDEGVFISNAENFPKGSANIDLLLSYGIQRNFLKRLNWDMAIQTGINIYNRQAFVTVGFNLQLGFIVFSN